MELKGWETTCAATQKHCGSREYQWEISYKYKEKRNSIKCKYLPLNHLFVLPLSSRMRDFFFL